MTVSRLRMSGIRKSYGPTEALRGVDLELRPGEVHALIGENGAGKSTLMKVLGGAVRPDAGSMTLNDRAFQPDHPGAACMAGIAMIHQELALVPHLNVEANVLLGVESSAFGFLNRAGNRKRTRDALADLEHPEIQPDTPLSALGPGARQLVEIARALVSDVQILVLDEPTSSLAKQDVERLFTLIRRLRGRGASIVYISHFLEEVEAVADRYTVLRDGQSVASGPVQGVARQSVVEQMVGRKLDEQFPRVAHDIGEPVLTLDSLAGAALPANASMTLHRGEILGIAGIVGAGRTEMLRAIYGLDPIRSGAIRFKSWFGPVRPAERIAQGMGLLSEDRKVEGLSVNQSLAENLTLSALSRYTTAGLLNLQRWRSAVTGWLGKLNVKFASIDQPAAELSGGNQQKLALGRLLHQDADVLLLDEPTRGVDVGSKAEIYRLIGQLAGQGRAILFVSSYLPELLGVCDRLAVMCRGRLGQIRPVSDWTSETVMAAAIGSA